MTITWEHVPSCPCFQCEDYRKENSLSCMYGLGPRPDQSPNHNWYGQMVFADPLENPLLSNAHSAPETDGKS